MLDERTRRYIERELEQLERLLREYHVLLEAARTGEPDLVERTALGSILQSFYTGVESIFETIAKRVDRDMPAGEEWHKELLARMTRSAEVRGPVISADTADLLEPYLGFRHVYRHAYSFLLEWGQMRNLVLDLGRMWALVRADIREMLKSEGCRGNLGKV